jgi:hypothetical protein
MSNLTLIHQKMITKLVINKKGLARSKKVTILIYYTGWKTNTRKKSKIRLMNPRRRRVVDSC